MTYQIHIAGTGIAYPCGSDETLLDAALRAGIEIPYSCRKGACGNCAAPVPIGSFTSVRSSSENIPNGQELLCQCRPLSDLTIAPTTWSRLEPGARKKLQLKVYRNTLVAPDVSVLYLRLPAGQRVKFRAGQYLQICLPDGQRRSFSMANPPHESDSIQLHVRHVKGGLFSSMVSTLQPGQLLEAELPFGQLDINPTAETPLVCVCTGTGFAPVKSLIDDLARRKSIRPVTLVWGARDHMGLYLVEHLEKWANSLPNWRNIKVLQDGQQAVAHSAIHGRVESVMPTVLKQHPDADVYCCGSPSMVAAVRNACLQDLALPPNRFHADVFASTSGTFD